MDLFPKIINLQSFQLCYGQINESNMTNLWTCKWRRINHGSLCCKWEKFFCVTFLVGSHLYQLEGKSFGEDEWEYSHAIEYNTLSFFWRQNNYFTLIAFLINYSRHTPSIFIPTDYQWFLLITPIALQLSIICSINRNDCSLCGRH